VFIPPSAQLGRNYFVQFLAGVNGWAIEVLDDAFLPFVTERGDYGAITQQFTNLAKLWSTYRINSVSAHFSPSAMYQMGSLSPTLTIVDVLGGSKQSDFPNSLGWYSRSKSLNIIEPFHKAHRTLNFDRWLSQVVPKPWLRTDLLGTRERYE